jgi:hypothetical protein
VGGMADAIEHGIAQIDVWRSHVDLGPQDMHSVGEFACPHPAKEIQIFIDRSGSVRAIFARLGERPPIFAHLIGRQAIDVGFAFLNEDHGKFVELLEIV